ncbi:xenotropic and polytropic retrovirus receptor 1 homolog isoform X2 [Drosophila grimshawi]|uniref:xenotropic and polytropic retrovirus receptor 1 homolog isoform X2 n=1 Tax=Drosophila grimshawi TaxID=7222 RepID=UPI000C86EAD9|nr:xenotropic and polytropic retrovirus receptor 1 homolog isoform X2 [Drosophila grimshawi]
MKFGKTFESHLTTEWRQQYMKYSELNEMIRRAVVNAPDAKVTRDLRHIREKDYVASSEELSRVMDFYAQKLAEAHRKLEAIRAQLILELGPARGTTARHLGLACSEFYLSLIMLQNFWSLNYTAFRKICKKYDKYIRSERGASWFRYNVVEPELSKDELLAMIVEVERLYTTHLTNGDRAKAMAKLRVPPLRRSSPPAQVFLAGVLLGLFVVSAIMVIISFYYLIVFKEVETLMPFGRLYRGLFCWVLCCFYLAINVYVWQNVGINHVLIFNVDLRRHMPATSFLEVAGGMGYLCALTMLLFLHHNEFGVDDPYPFPLVCLLLPLAILINPVRIMNYSARVWMLRCLGRVLTAPFFHVRFADFWLADQMNSLSLCLVDSYHLIRFYFRYYTNSDSSFEFEPDCAAPVIRCLPAGFRLAQCMRRYWDSSDRPISYPLNAVKYATSIAAVICSTIVMESNDNYVSMFDNPWIWSYLIISLISTVYSTTWDLVWDFGLFQVWKGEHFLLRENLIYRKWFYYLVIVANILIRCFWMLEVYLIYNEILLPYNCKTIATLCEITRRFLWNFLRLENEHLFNCGSFRATRDIFLTPLNLNAEESSERRDSSPINVRKKEF